MLAYCGRPAAAAFCDPFPYIVPRYARETIAEICSLGVALATAIISQPGSQVEPPWGRAVAGVAQYSIRPPPPDSGRGRLQPS
jgi:hypothetical protein